MTTFELVDKENALGTIGGTLYGSAVRIVARSPTHILFHGLGARIFRRGGEGWHDDESLFKGRPTIALYETVRDKIDEVFGAGAGEQTILAWRRKKTLLVDGGGEPLALPNREVGLKAYAAYNETSVSSKVELTGAIPTCKQCAKNLKPKTALHWMGYELLPDHPRSLADCQKLTNHQVIAAFDYGVNHPERAGYIERFETWDGQSTWDPHFCDDKCAAKYGRRAALVEPLLEPGIEPEKVVWSIHESTNHYEPKDREGVILPGGTTRL